MFIDIEKLRDYLTDYYGTAVFAGMPAALIDVTRVSHAPADELIRIAQKEHVDLTQFEI